MIPHQMNCPHSGDGWCLSCVDVLARRMERIIAMLEDLECDAERIDLESPQGDQSQARGFMSAAVSRARRIADQPLDNVEQLP